MKVPHELNVLLGNLSFRPWGEGESLMLRLLVGKIYEPQAIFDRLFPSPELLPSIGNETGRGDNIEETNGVGLHTGSLRFCTAFILHGRKNRKCFTLPMVIWNRLLLVCKIAVVR